VGLGSTRPRPRRPSRWRSGARRRTCASTGCQPCRQPGGQAGRQACGAGAAPSDPNRGCAIGAAPKAPKPWRQAARAAGRGGARRPRLLTFAGVPLGQHRLHLANSHKAPARVARARPRVDAVARRGVEGEAGGAHHRLVGVGTDVRGGVACYRVDRQRGVRDSAELRELKSAGASAAGQPTAGRWPEAAAAAGRRGQDGSPPGVAAGRLLSIVIGLAVPYSAA
jgi:hypothetical protein